MKDEGHQKAVRENCMHGLMRERWTIHTPILQIETYTFNLQT